MIHEAVEDLFADFTRIFQLHDLLEIADVLSIILHGLCRKVPPLAVLHELV